MGLDSCMKCLKYTLFLFNFFFWLAGCAIVALGLFVYLSPWIRDQIRGEGLMVEAGLYLMVALVILGGVMMLISFLGCCGSILENKCMLLVFFTIMTIIFLALIALGLYVIIDKNNIRSRIKSELRGSLLNDTDFYNETQHGHNCCGVEKSPKDLFPCKENAPRVDTTQKMGSVDCDEVLTHKVFDSCWLYYIIGIFVPAGITLIGMILAIMLCCALRDYYE